MKTTIKYIGVIIGMVIALFSTNFNLNAQTDTPPTAVSANSGGGGGGSGPVVPPVIQPPPEFLPADLQDWAWERVRQGYLYSSATSAVRSSDNQKDYADFDYNQPKGYADPVEIFGIVRTQQLVLKVLYPTNWLTVGCGLYDTNWAPLFYAYFSTNITAPQSGVTASLVFEMSSEIWIPFDGARWVEFIERDENGNAIRYYFSEVQNGMLRYPSYFDKKNGEVQVHMADGTTVSYALNGGNKIIPTPVPIGIGEVSAVGLRTILPIGDGDSVFVQVTDEESSRNINPLIRLGRRGSGEVKFIAWRRNLKTGEIEYASAIRYWSKSMLDRGLPANRKVITSPDHTIVIPMHASEDRVRFEWPSGWPYGNQFGPPYTYNGDGKG